jgi:uroporphyrinogen decarboxylase
MNSRERVRCAVNHRPPDRVPIDLGGIRASGISAVVYHRIKERLGIHSPTKIHDTMQLLAEIELEVAQRLHVDVLPLDAGDAAWAGQPAAAGVARRLPGGVQVSFQPGTRIVVEPGGSWALHDEGGHAVARMPSSGFYFDFVRPTMAVERIDPDACRPPSMVPEATLRAMEERSRQLYAHTDKALVGWGASISLMGLSALLSDNITQGSLDQWLCMLMTEKAAAHQMMDRCAEAAISQMALYHQAVGDRCVAWGVASDDAGTQRCELIDPGLFAEMIKPHYRRVCDWVHTHTTWKTYLHSCGAIHDYIPHWIEAGIDILNPVQISAANMEPERLMADFGGRIVFWGGGCDTQGVLPRSSAMQVREHVRSNIQAFDRGTGGYVFCQVHNIQPDVPVENVEAMLAAAYEYGSCAQRS